MSVHPVDPAGGASRKPVTQLHLAELRARGEPIAVLTCYDASFASLLDDVGIECLLIGDSLGMVVQGHDSTLPVTLDEVAYHTRCVTRAARHATRGSSPTCRSRPTRRAPTAPSRMRPD